MDFVKRTVDDGNDNWVKDLSVFRESERMEAFDKASTAVTEGAKENEMSEFADEFVWKAKDVGKECRLRGGSIAVIRREYPDYDDEEDWKNDSPISLDCVHACFVSQLWFHILYYVFAVNANLSASTVVVRPVVTGESCLILGRSLRKSRQEVCLYDEVLYNR